MSNHLSPEPPPSWAWSTMAPDQHGARFFTQQQLHPHHRQQPAPPPEGNAGRELLFEKPLTPSDVGKLNRLVIPKQHAERHFPLDAADCAERGLLLSFEDESGRAWQFRYSYWTSSQSYVLTKGWSRFVKEKRLDAGDVVIFERWQGNGGGGGLLHIGCKRRGELTVDGQGDSARRGPAAQWKPDRAYGGAGQSPATSERTPYSAEGHPYTAAAPSDPPDDHAGDQAAAAAAGRSAKAIILPSSRRLRLFGVNLDCGPEQEQPESAETHGLLQFMHRGTGWQ